MRSRAVPARLTRIIELAVYGLVALAVTWPLPRHAFSHLPLGQARYATVPLFNLWTIWWNSDRALVGFRDYWDAPIFAPEPGSFAFSETQSATLVVAPIIWLTGSRILATNVYLWMTLSLNAIAARSLLRTLRVSRLVAFVGGLGILLLPAVHWQLDVIQLAAIWGVLWSWSAVLRMGRRPTLWRGLELGLAFIATFHTCSHHAVCLALLLPPASIALGRRWGDIRLWRAVSGAVLVAALGTLPVILPLREAIAAHGFQRSAATVAKLSAQPLDYLRAPGVSWWGAGRLYPATRRPLSPGWLTTALAVFGCLAVVRDRRIRTGGAFLVLLIVSAAALSLGPEFKIGSWQPWIALSRTVPGLAQVRSVFRFAFFVQAALVILAAVGVHAFTRWAAWRIPAACRSPGTILMTLGLGFLAFSEVLPRRTRLAAPPALAGHRDWIDSVRKDLIPGRSIVCLPVSSGNSVGDYESTTRWMSLGTFHQAPLVNGYSGFFPAAHFEMRQSLNREFPSHRTLQMLSAAHVQFIVIDSRWVPTADLTGDGFRPYKLEHWFASSTSAVVVYRLRNELETRILRDTEPTHRPSRP